MTTAVWTEENLVKLIQIYLKKINNYKGAVDGKLSTPFYDAIAYTVQSQKINTKGWTKARFLVAGEQLLYKSEKIETGNIDGLVGPQTNYAREVYKAKVTVDFVAVAEKVHEETAAPPVVIKSTGKIVPFQKWPTQSGNVSFFGNVGTNQTTLKLPYPMVLSWDLKKTVKSWSCHKLAAPAFERWLTRTFDYYGYEKIKELRLHYWGGTLNVRKVRGGTSWSQHSWGTACDIDPDRNSLNTSWKNAQMSKPDYKKFVEFWYDEGGINLGVERNYDPMHFQLSRL